MEITWVFLVMLNNSDVNPSKAGPTNNPRNPKVLKFAAAVFKLSVVFLSATLIAIGKKFAEAKPSINKPISIK